MGVRGRIGEVFAEYGLSHAAGNALAVIEGAGRPLTAGEIGAAVHITSGSITSLVDTLESKGLARRFADPDDRRKVLIDVTPEGEALLDEALPRVQVRARQLMDGLSPAEQRRFIALLERVAENARSLDEPVEAPHGRRTPAHLRPPRDTDGRRVPDTPG